MVRFSFAMLAVVVLSMNSAVGAEWGTLKGRFVVDGKTPAPAALSVTQDKPVCCKGGCPNDDSLVVGPQGGLANVVIYVRTKTGQKIAVHPDYADAAKKDAVLDNTGCMFAPHVSAVQTGQKLILKNSDPVAHNTNIQPIKNDAQNITIPVGGSGEYVFKTAETLPTKVVCNVHPWMMSYVIARDDPYVTVSGVDGTFEIKNLPAGGTLEFQLWHERTGYLRDVEVAGKEAKRGRAKIEIKAGDNDLGDIKVPAAALEKQ